MPGKRFSARRGARGLAGNPRLLARFFIREMLVGSGMITGKMQPANSAQTKQLIINAAAFTGGNGSAMKPMYCKREDHD